MRAATFLVSVALATTCAYARGGEKNAFCLDPEHAKGICAAKSNLATKVPAAKEACASTAVAAGRRRRPSGGKGGARCPPFADLIADIEAKFAGHSCVMYNMGWIDEMGNENNATIAGDLASLQPGMLAGLDGAEVAQCTRERMIRKTHKFQRCADKYSEGEMAELMNVFTEVARFQCFQADFDRACSKFIQAEYVEPLLQSLYAASG